MHVGDWPFHVPLDVQCLWVGPVKIYPTQHEILASVPTVYPPSTSEPNLYVIECGKGCSRGLQVTTIKHSYETMKP